MEPTMPALHCSITSCGLADDEQRRADDRQASGGGREAISVRAFRVQPAAGPRRSRQYRPLAASTMASPGQAREDFGVEARSGDLARHELSMASADGAQSASVARAPICQPRPGCRQASGRAPSPANRVGVRRRWPGDEVDHHQIGLARRARRRMAHGGGCASEASVLDRGRSRAPVATVTVAQGLTARPGRWPGWRSCPRRWSGSWRRGSTAPRRSPR